jgi:hypothetical protein
MVALVFSTSVCYGSEALVASLTLVGASQCNEGDVEFAVGAVLAVLACAFKGQRTVSAECERDVTRDVPVCDLDLDIGRSYLGIAGEVLAIFILIKVAITSIVLAV